MRKFLSLAAASSAGGNGSGGSDAAGNGGSVASVRPLTLRLIAALGVVIVGGCHSSSASNITSPSGGAGGTGGGGILGSDGTRTTGGSAAGGTSDGGASATGGRASDGDAGMGGAPGSGGHQPDAAPSVDAVGPRDADRGDGPGPDAPGDDGIFDLAPDRPMADVPQSGVYKPSFILGADVTITLEDEYWGATYTDNGQQKSLEQILKDHGFNFIRLDTFVNPSAPGGYATSMPEAFRDLAHTITLAKRIKKIGMGFMLDLHYSDTWTNAGAQAAPAAWAGQAPTALQTTVYDYTKDAITQLKNQGAMPDMVSVGNEITNGMLWDAGRITNSNFANFASLLKAGVRAVREVNPDIVVVMHLDKCNNTSTTKWWLDGILGQGVSFDVLGQSCYASAPNGVAAYQGTPADWKSTFTELASAYPHLKFLIAEYSAEQRAAGDVMVGLPDKRGLGTFNWDPTRSYATHPNDPLFSTDGAWNHYVAIPAKLGLYDQMARDYGL